ncbi:glycosyltransferase, partial [Gluconobacter japonicus]
MRPGLHIFADDGQPDQRPFDVAVVIPSLLRPTLKNALDSVFAQIGHLRVQILIGVDVAPPDGAQDMLKQISQGRPEGWSLQVLWPGYSTSERHGGFGKAWDGG